MMDKARSIVWYYKLGCDDKNVFKYELVLYYKQEDLKLKYTSLGHIYRHIYNT
jgi:hypothetical protein